MYKFLVLFATFLFGCSSPPAATLTVSCDRSTQDEYSVNCGNGDDSDVIGAGDSKGQPDAGPPIVLAAGCYQDLDVCPPQFKLSWLVEHCTIPYVCPDNSKGDINGVVCLRFIMEDCWDQYSN